jgi:hypothetical protein
VTAEIGRLGAVVTRTRLGTVGAILGHAVVVHSNGSNSEATLRQPSTDGCSWPAAPVRGPRRQLTLASSGWCIGSQLPGAPLYSHSRPVANIHADPRGTSRSTS